MQQRLGTPLVMAALLAGCLDGQEQAPPDELVEQDSPIAGVTCPTGASAEVCSGPGSVWSSLHRAGRSATALSEVAQGFRVSRTGFAGRARLKFRLARSLETGENPSLRVSVRPLVGGVLPVDASGDVAVASVSAGSLPRRLPAEIELAFVPANPAAPVPLQPGTDYALVVRVDAPATGSALVGIAAHDTDVYPDGHVWRRTTTSASTFGTVAWTAQAGHDLSFALTLGDGANLDECALEVDDCDPDATCADTSTGWTCTCNEGFEGDGTVDGTGCDWNVAELASLTVAPGTLTPSFASATTGYALVVPVWTQSFALTPSLAAGHVSTITVNAGPVASGAGVNVPLTSLGANVVSVVVTAESGVARTYTLEVQRGEDESYLKAANTQASDRFGEALAVDGDTLVVGARRESSCATTVNGNAADNGCAEAGAAYVFVRTGGAWTQQAYLKASNAGAGDHFGESVSVSGDTVLIGARREDGCGTGVGGDQSNNGCVDAGAAYVFVRSGTTWTQQAYLKASNTEAGDGFGARVAVSGTTGAVGAPDEDSCATTVGGDGANNACGQAGAVYVFARAGDTWQQQAYVKASNGNAGDGLGESLGLFGDTLVAGAPNEDGCATTIGGDGANNLCAQQGAAYVFQRTNATWAQQAYLKASNGAADDLFGRAVALSGDTAAVGAPGEDGCATGIGGDEANNGCSGAGAAYVFTRAGSAWAQQAYLKASNSGAGDGFGTALALSGNLFVAGAPNEGGCGTDVAGNGADDACAGAGAAYLFRRSGSTWSGGGYLKAPNTDAADLFGTAVGVAGDHLAVGALDEDGCATGTNGDESSNGCASAGAAFAYRQCPAGTTFDGTACAAGERPFIAAVTPADLLVGAASYALTVLGSGFDASTTVAVEAPVQLGSTTFVSPTRLDVAVTVPTNAASASIDLTATKGALTHVGANAVVLSKRTDVTVSAVVSLNTQAVTPGRTFADGIAFRVVAPTDGATVLGRYGGTDSFLNGLAVGDSLLVVNLQGASGNANDVGNWEVAQVGGLTASTLTLTAPLTRSYDGTSGAAQKVVVQRIPVWGNVSITGSGALTASAWNALAAAPYATGIVAFRAAGSVTIASTARIDADALGFRGGSGSASGYCQYGYNGEGADQGTRALEGARNMGGGEGGDRDGSWCIGAAEHAPKSGGGGSHGTEGTNGSSSSLAGLAYGDAAFAQIHHGGGGGGSSSYRHSSGSGSGGTGGTGGGMVMVWAASVTNSGAIRARGGNGANYVTHGGGGGGGAGGSVFVETGSFSGATPLVTGGTGGSGYAGGIGGNGGAGIVLVTQPQ